MEIVWLTKSWLNHMNKENILFYWCVAIVSTCLGDSWYKSQSPLEDESGKYSCEDLHGGCKLIRKSWSLDYCKHNVGN